MAVKSHSLEVYFVHTIPFFPKYVIKVRKQGMFFFYYKVQDNEVKTLLFHKSSEVLSLCKATQTSYLGM